MSTTPPLVGRQIEMLLQGVWLSVVITEANGGGIAVKPLHGSFPDGSDRKAISFPLTLTEWRQ